MGRFFIANRYINQFKFVSILKEFLKKPDNEEDLSGGSEDDSLKKKSNIYSKNEKDDNDSD